MNITEDYCSYEVAKLLKEKGFIEPCLYYYFSNGKIEKAIGLKDKNTACVSTFSAPTHQMAMKWLREVHKLHIDIDPSEGDWSPTVISLEDWSCVVKFGDNIPIQDTYEESVEAALKYSLENLI